MQYRISAKFSNDYAQAAQTAPVSTSGILDKLRDPASARQLRQALDVLEQVAASKAEDTKTINNDGHKTVGDALDKGLDMAKSTVVYLAAKIEQVAPQLWHVLIL